MVLLTVRTWKLYEPFGDVTTPEISCQSLSYSLWFLLHVSCHDLFDFVLNMNFAFPIGQGIGPAGTSAKLLQNAKGGDKLQAKQVCKPGLAQSQMLKHLMGLDLQRNRACLTYRSSAGPGLLSDSIVFNFPITLLISADIRSSLQLAKVAPCPMKLMEQLHQLMLNCQPWVWVLSSTGEKKPKCMYF